MNLATVLEYPLGPLRWALAGPDGSLCKTNKAALLHLVEEDVSPVIDDVPVSAWIVDGMALLRSFQGSRCNTFGELSTEILNLVLSCEHSVGGRVDFVCDCYWKQSIKSAERERRAIKSSGFRVVTRSREQTSPQRWSDYLKVDENKEDFVRFLAEDWLRPEFAQRLSTCQLYVTSGTQCWRYSGYISSGV